MSEYKRQIVDLLDFERKIHSLIESSTGKPQFIKGLRKAQMICLELARPHDMQRTGSWIRNEYGWTCSICDQHVNELTRYCDECGARMSNYESETERYEN